MRDRRLAHLWMDIMCFVSHRALHAQRVSPQSSATCLSSTIFPALTASCSRMPRIPDLPGALVQHNSDQERWLKRHVAILCRLENERYVAQLSILYPRPVIQYSRKVSWKSACKLCIEGLGQA